MKKHKSEKAYRRSKNIYDNVLLQEKPLSKMYSKIFWNGCDNREIAKRLLQTIPNDFSGSLLDVPVGTALFTAEKYSRLQNADIVCLDASEDMLTQADIKFAEKGIENVRCIKGDVGNLPFPNESFDIVLSMNGFHSFADKSSAFAETWRVLKKGGTFLGCFYVKGLCPSTDILVKTILTPNGWFTPPFFNSSQLHAILKIQYSMVKMSHMGSIVYFRCKK